MIASADKDLNVSQFESFTSSKISSLVWSSCIPLCDQLSGTIDKLTVDKEYECDTIGITIDTLVVDMTNQVDDDNDVRDWDSSI